MADKATWTYARTKDKASLLFDDSFRHLSSDDNYKLESHGCLQQQDQVLRDFHVCSEVWADSHAASVDNRVIIVRDGQEDASTILTFEDTVDVIRWSPDGLFLIVGDRGGVLHFVHRLTGAIAFSKKLVDALGEMTFVSLHISSGHKGMSHLVMMTADNCVKIFANLNFTCLHEALLQNSKTKVQSTVASVSLGSFVIKDMASKPLAVVSVCLERDPAVFVLGTRRAELVLWKKSRDGSYKPMARVQDSRATDAKEIQVLGNRHLICLANEGQLCMYDLVSVAEVRQWTLPNVDSFCLIHAANPYCKRFEDLRIATVSKQEVGSCLTIIRLCDLSAIYTLHFSGHCWLPKVPVTSGDLHVIADTSGNCHNKLSSSSGLMLYSVTEAAPQDRYERLLKQKNFEAAKALAAKHGLDLKHLHIAKITCLVDRLHDDGVAADGMGTNKDAFQLLLSELDSMDDLSFVLNVCLTVNLPVLSTATDVMRYALRRIEKQLLKPGAAASNEAREVLQLLWKMETYRLAFAGLSSSLAWQAFCKADVIEEALQLLHRGDYVPCMVILERHKGELHGRMSDDVLRTILSSVPTEIIPYPVLRSLVKMVAELLHSELPQGFAAFGDWLEQLIGTLEHDPLWPGNALELIGIVVDEARGLHESVATEKVLSKLLGQLQSLQHVNKKYGLKLRFGQFLVETKETVAFHLLDQAKSLDSLAKVISQPLLSYARETLQHCDELLLAYLKESLRRRDKRFCYLPEAAWECRAVVVINHISTPTIIVDAILAVLPVCHTPWTPAIRELAQKALLLNDPRMAEVEMRIQQDKLSGLLEKYGIFQELSIVNVDVKLFVKHVLSSSHEDCVADALALADFSKCMSRVDVFCSRARHLLFISQDEQCCALVQSPDLSKQEQSVIIRRVVDFCTLYVDDVKIHSGMCKNDALPRRLALGKAALQLISQGRKLFDAAETHHYKKLQSTLRQVLQLQTDFQLIVSTAEVQEQRQCEHLFKQYLEKQCKAKDDEPNMAGNRVFLAQIRRLRKLLGLCISGDLDVALSFIDMERVSSAMAICREFVRFESEMAEADAETAYSIIHRLLREDRSSSEAVVNCINELQYLANAAAAWCSPGKLPDCTQTASLWDLLVSTFKNSTASSGPNTSDVSDQFGRHFVESNFILDFKNMLSKVWHYAACVMPPLDGSLPCFGRRYYASDCLHGRRILPNADEQLSSDYGNSLAVATASLVKALKESEHLTLALRTVTSTLSVALRRLSIQSPGDVERNPKLQARSWKIVTLGSSELKEHSGKILNKILVERRIDRDLALGYMCMLPKKYVYSLLVEQISSSASTGQQYARVLHMAKLSEAYGKLIADDTIVKLSTSATADAEWACRLSKDHVNFKSAFMKPSGRKAILPQIIERCGTATLLDFYESHRADVDIDDVLQRKLEKLVVAHNSVVTSLTDATRCDSKLRSILDDIELLLSRVSSDSIRRQMLSMLISKASPYNYELLFFVYERLLNLDPEDVALRKGMRLLVYLLPYERVSPHSEFEADLVGTTDSSPLNTDLMIGRRLPFHALLGGNSWKILTGELNDQTVDPLLAVASLLKLSPDHIYVTAVRNMATAYMKCCSGAKGTAEMSRSLGTNTFLEKAEGLLCHVKDKEMAVACMQWIAQGLPDGTSERVQALQASVALAQDWCSCEKKPDLAIKAQDALNRLTASYQEAAVSRLLGCHGLKPATYAHLASDPEALIESLYSDTNLSQWTTSTCSALTYVGNAFARPDIYDIVEEVAKIFGVSMDKLSKGLAKSWLGSAEDSQTPVLDDLNNSMTVISNMNISLSPNAYTSKLDQVGDDGSVIICKVLAILRHVSIDSSVAFLFNMAFRDQMVDESVRFRALNCLLTMCKMEDLERMTRMCAADYRKKYEDFDLLLKLRGFRMTYSLGSMALCSKDTIIRNLWQRHRSEPQALKLICELCIKYKFTDLVFIGGLLHQLVEAKQLVSLNRLLPWCLEVQPDLMQQAAFKSAWNLLLLSTFERCSGTTGDGCLDYADFLSLLISCPIIDQINLCKVHNTFKSSGFEACSFLLGHLGGTSVSPDTSSSRDAILQQCQQWKPSYPLLAAQVEFLVNRTR